MSYVSYIFIYLEKKKQFFIFRRKKEFYVFLVFLGRQEVCLRSYVSSGVMRKSDLSNSLDRKQLVCWVDFFFFF